MSNRVRVKHDIVFFRSQLTAEFLFEVCVGFV